jgi:hypothetical protein
MWMNTKYSNASPLFRVMILMGFMGELAARRIAATIHTCQNLLLIVPSLDIQCTNVVTCLKIMHV